MTKLLSGDNAYNRIMGRLFDLTLISVLTFLCCLPVVTAGAALSSACAMFMKIAENREGAICKGYFREFREEWKRSIGGWIVHLMILFVLGADLYLTKSYALQYGVTLALLVIWAATFYWYLCLRARFRENTVSALINAVKFSLVYMPTTLICAVFVVILTALLFHNPMMIGLIPVAGVWMFLYLPSVLIGKKIDAYITDKGLVPENSEPVEREETEKTTEGNMDALTETSAQYRDASVAEGFRKYLSLRIRSEKEKMNRMQKKERVQYITTYYRGVILSLVLLTIVGVIMINGAKEEKQHDVLRVVVVNSYHDNALNNEEIGGLLMNDLIECGMQQTEHADVYYDTDYQIAYVADGKDYIGTAANDSDYDKFFLNIRSGRIDAAIVPESFLTYCDALEDVYGGMALDITESEFVKKAGIAFVGDNAGEKCYLILPVGGQNEQNASLFRDYLLQQLENGRI